MAFNKLVLQVVTVGILAVAGCVQASSHAFLPAGVTSEVDGSPVDKAATQGLPQAWVAYDWAKHDDGHCSYKGYRARHCPDRELDFWDTLIPKSYNCPPAPATPSSTPCESCAPPKCIAGSDPCVYVPSSATALQKAAVVPCCPGFTCKSNTGCPITSDVYVDSVCVAVN